MQTFLILIAILAAIGAGIYFLTRRKSAPPAGKPGTTGVVYSDIERTNAVGEVIRGWIKGWVPETANRRVAIVCRHSNPFEGAKLYTIDAAGTKFVRTVTKVFTDNYKIDGGQPSQFDDYYGGGDISICQVDESWPASIVPYRIANSVNAGQDMLCFRNESHKFSPTKALIQRSIAWISAQITPLILIGGDSGLPWFVNEGQEWKVCSHFTRGADGQGPNYAHSSVRAQLVANITRMDTATL